MKIGKLSFGILGLAILLGLQIAPAHAQATRTWVSGVGDDANPCSRTAPCKTFAGAITKTAPAGEINVLDPGGFGGITITKAITLSAVGVEGGVLVSGTPGITVAAGPTDNVVLEGLDIEGLGTGTNGINVISGLRVFIKNVKIHAFANNGINMASSTSGARLVVKDSFIFQNGTLNSAPLTGGINLNGTSNVAVIMDTVVDSNQNFAVQSSGTGNIATVARTDLSGPNGLSTVNGGTSICFGPSNVIGGSFTCTTSTAFQ